MTTKEKVLKLRAEGKTVGQTAAILGITTSGVCEHSRGLPKIHSKVTQEDVDRIKELRATGMIFKDISKEVKICTNSVRQYFYGKLTVKSLERASKKDYMNNRSKKIKQQCVDYKGGCCSICGYNKSLYSLDFHHVNPKEKAFGIARRNSTFVKLKPELDKCILVCRNCHGEIHEKEGGTRSDLIS